MSEHRLLIVEEALKNYLGHWYEYNRSIIAANKAAGVEVTVLSHCQVDKKVSENLGAIPTFKYTSWDGIYSSPSALRRYWGILKHNWRVFKTLDKYFTRSQPYDCVFVPTVIIYHLIGWWFIAKKYSRKKIHRLVLFIRNNAASYAEGSSTPIFKRSTFFLKTILQAYRGWIDSGVVCFATDCDRLAKEYKILCGIDFLLIPSQQMPCETKEHVFKKAGDFITMSCLGPARYEKGGDLLCAAVIQFRERYPQANVKFIIQWNDELTAPDGSQFERAEILKNDPNVLFLNRALSSEDYLKYFMETDCMILPYRRQSYHSRLSGIAIEAFIAGIPVIFTRDTWIEDAVSKFGVGLGIENENIQDLVEKIKIMAAQIDDFKKEALKKAPSAQAAHSPEKFMECLWGRRL